MKSPNVQKSKRPNRADVACGFARPDNEFAAVCDRFRALPAPSMIDDLIIERGTFDDYRRLAQFHYKGAKPGAIKTIFRITHQAPTVVGRYLGRGEQTQIVGVLVCSLPALSCRLRDLATNHRYGGLKPRDAAVMLNREVRTISRVVIDPQWRGLGLAVKLVRHALEHPEEVPGASGQVSGRAAEFNRYVGTCHLTLGTCPLFTEALAAMGRVSPFFEHAGMTRYERPLRGPTDHARLLDALEHLGIEPAALASLRSIHDHLRDCGESAQRWLFAELRRWHRAAHRTPTAALDLVSIDDLLIAARDELLAQPVYYLFKHSVKAQAD